MNKELENISKKILAETSIPEDEKFGSVIALLMVLSLCFTAIRIIQECNKVNSSVEDIYGDMKKFCNQRALARWRLRREMRKVMTTGQYIKYRGELESAILNVGNNISLSETKTLMEAIND
jgi:hypothetical protein|tara:strand:+ start:1153 stop:1515 length:363 start_codon:yes stop_codon:yes gene_type:complete